MTDLTRRRMLTVTAAATGGLGSIPFVGPATADNAEDLDLFITLSSALTGIAKNRLAPAVDPIQIAIEYFKQASADKAFAGLMQIIRDNRADPAAAANKVANNTDAGIKYLGRSIILAWYLGAWYDPKKLAVYNSPTPGVFPLTPAKVISPKAYTQGWAWRIAQAHPMGYSELRFGYWSEDPPKLDDFIIA
jgi:Membrane bound FAD containing D-sorbitol dehydrogenase